LNSGSAFLVIEKLFPLDALKHFLLSPSCRRIEK
jgi:hypothetical protein